MISTPRDLLKSLAKTTSKKIVKKSQDCKLISTKKKQSANIKKQNTKEGKLREQRKVTGWSMPRASPKSGPLPKCRGCNKPIERYEKRLRNKFQSKQYHKFEQVWQFHLKVSCLVNLRAEHMKSFLAKKWTTKRAQEVQKSLAQLGLDSEESE